MSENQYPPLVVAEPANAIGVAAIGREHGIVRRTVWRWIKEGLIPAPNCRISTGGPTPAAGWTGSHRFLETIQLRTLQLSTRYHQPSWLDWLKSRGLPPDLA